MPRHDEIVVDSLSITKEFNGPVGRRTGAVRNSKRAGMFGEIWYTIPDCQTRATITPGVGTLIAIPWFAPVSGILDLFSMRVTTTGGVGSLYRFGFYAGDSELLVPTGLLFDSNQQDGTVVAINSIAANVRVFGGALYFGVYVCTVGAPTVIGLNTASQLMSLYGTDPGSMSQLNCALQLAFTFGVLPGQFPGPIGGAYTLIQGSVLPIISVRYQ